ncbi:MAG: DUF3574 domain-containing protein [Bacteroidia bacterium]
MKAPVILWILLLLAGCQTAWPGSERLLRVELYFGMNRPDGTRIPVQDWDAFLDTCITPRFPEELTVLEGQGQWRGARGELVQEPSRIVCIYHAPGRELTTALDEIVTAYKQRFDQEAVLHSVSRAKIRF